MRWQPAGFFRWFSSCRRGDFLRLWAPKVAVIVYFRSQWSYDEVKYAR